MKLTNDTRVSASCDHNVCVSVFPAESVGFYKLRGEVFSGEILPVSDSVWREANGGLAGRDSERFGHRLIVEAGRRSVDSQRESLPAERSSGVSRHCLHRRREHRGGSN